MKGFFKKMSAVLLAAVLVCNSAFVFAASSDDLPMTAELDLESRTDALAYANYLSAHESAAGSGDRVITARQCTDAVTPLVDYKGQAGESLRLEGGTETAFRFSVDTAGLYTITLRWIQVESKGVNVELGVKVNGAFPYAQADQLTLNRIWENSTEIQQDISGNDIRPSQREAAIWQDTILRDSNGYITTPLQFYFESGKNTVTLCAKGEPFVLHSITLAPLREAPSYAAVKKAYDAAGYTLAETEPIIIEGEAAAYKSSATLYPTADRSSPSTQPSEAGVIKMNKIGGSNWAYSGDFLIWNVDVKEAGLYRLAIKSRQNITSGVVSNRRVYIDGVVPFAEADQVEVGYDAAWQLAEVKAGEEPCLFYLTAGSHQIKLEVHLGDMGEILEESTDILAQLNKIYREILVLTGASPSVYRDYKLTEYIPDTVENINTQHKRILVLIDRLAEISGEQNSENIGTLRTIEKQLQSMYAAPDKIARKLSFFKTNIGSLGTWINSNRQQPLEVDYLALYGADDTLPATNANFFSKLLFSVKSFFCSFFTDYKAIGNLTEVDSADAITVWISSGRDQMQILKSLINDSFSPDSGIPVSLQLVDHGTLMSATMSGTGPDVALNCTGAEPVNYALRGAAYDLTTFADFEEFKKQFNAELFVPFYVGKSCYAIPETQSFNVLFYRTDVLREIGLEIPRTWDEVVSAISVLNKNNMEFCLSGTVDTGTMYMFLMQNGGTVFNEKGDASVLNNDISVRSFKQWTNFYLNYSVSQEIDFVNRFRTGEVPLGIAGFTTYNNLAVSAPEIQGQWGFTVLPGTVNADGTVNRDTQLSGTAVMMLGNTKKPQESWAFMKWLMSTDTQSRFSSEMESILGESARYNTANKESFNRLPWRSEELNVLNTQLESARCVREVPGGYYVSRHLLNAYRKVVNHDGDAKDTLVDYTYTINNEITNKRKEFGLE